MFQIISQFLILICILKHFHFKSSKGQFITIVNIWNNFFLDLFVFLHCLFVYYIFMIRSIFCLCGAKAQDSNDRIRPPDNRNMLFFQSYHFKLIFQIFNYFCLLFCYFGLNFFCQLLNLRIFFIDAFRLDRLASIYGILQNLVLVRLHFNIRHLIPMCHKVYNIFGWYRVFTFQFRDNCFSFILGSFLISQQVFLSQQHNNRFDRKIAKHIFYMVEDQRQFYNISKITFSDHNTLDRTYL